MRSYLVLGLLALSAAAFSPAAAQVASNGFRVALEANIDATPARVYEALVGQVGQWWSSDHTFSGDSRNLYIEARPGGCFCERLPNGGGVEHLRVVYAAPAEVLRLSGALGPLQAYGLSGSLTWTLTGVSGATTVELSYSVGGFFEGGFEGIAPAVQGVLSEQLQQLKSFVETGAGPDRDLAIGPSNDAADVAAIRALIAETEAANNAADTLGWVALFEDDAVYMPPGAPAVSSRDELVEMAAAGFGPYAADVEITPSEIVISGDWAFARSQVTGTVPRTGGEPFPVDLKQLVIYHRQQDGSWKIARLISNRNS